MSVEHAFTLAAATDRPARAGRLTRSWHLLIVALFGLDALALGFSFALSYIVRFRIGLPLLETVSHSRTFYTSIAFWVIPVWLGLFAVYHLYDRRFLFAGFQEYIRIVNSCTAGMIAVVVVSFLDNGLIISRGWLLLTWLFAILFVATERFAARRVLRSLRRRGWFLTPTVIVGANEEGKALAEQFICDQGAGTQVLGFIDDSREPGTAVVEGLKVVGGVQDLREVVRSLEIKEIVVAMTALPREVFLDLYRGFGQEQGLELKFSSGLFEILTTGLVVNESGCVPLMTPQRVRITGVDALLKSALDYLGALCGLLILWPLMLAIALLIKLDSPGPAIHRRKVLGRGGRAFYAYKFRSMVADADAMLLANEALRRAFADGYKLRRDPRVTRVGSLLRKTSLDELPQLLNVLRGEMSLVGPRMIAPDEALRYGKWQLNLLTVKPGITGPWQVHGRSDIEYDERVKLSMHYIRNYSIWLDLEILVRTLWVVVRRTGAY
ncbi:MAG TPA: sugar transferase [Chloroflexota bacterium]